MRFAAKVVEARRNVLTGTASTLQLALALGALAGGALALDFSAISDLEADARAFRASGATVQILTAEARVDGGSCDALGTADGIRSGALRPSEAKIEPGALRGGTVPAFDATPGFAEVLLGRQVGRGPGVLVSRSFAESFGLRAGAVLATREGGLRVSAVFDYPDDGRRPGLGYSVVQPVIASAPFDECWADLWPQSADLLTALRTTLTPGPDRDDQKSTVTQLNPTLGQSFAGADRYSRRLTRFAPLAAGGVAFFVVWGLLRLRRVELASAVHIGVSRNDIWGMLLLESVCWIIAVGAAIAPVVAFFAVAAPAEDRGVFLGSGLAAFAAVVCGGLTGLGIGALRVRERSLFALFKGRR